MLFLTAYSVLAILGLSAASYTDLKGRCVPNELSLGLIALGLGIHAVESFTLSSLEPIAYSLAGAAIAFVLAFILYKAGAWAGGDVKLLTALGALLPLPLTTPLPPAPIYDYPLFPVMVLANSVIVAFPFVMGYVFWKTFRDEELRKGLGEMALDALTKGLVFAGTLYGLSSLLSLASLPELLAFPVLFGVAFLPSRLRLGLAALLFLAGLFSSPIATFLLLLLAGIFVGGFFEAVAHGARALSKRVPAGELEEGMIPGELVYVEKGKVKTIERSWRDRLSMFEPEGTVVSDLKAAGLTWEQIARLKELKLRSLLVKESIPMIPILLLGCIVSLVLGDLVWFAISSV